MPYALSGVLCSFVQFMLPFMGLVLGMTGVSVGTTCILSPYQGLASEKLAGKRMLIAGAPLALVSGMILTYMYP